MSVALAVAAQPRGHETELFQAYAAPLFAAVAATVRTSPVNAEDACAFAWLQLLRRRPSAAVAFAWLCTTAIREAVKLQRRTAQTVDLDQVEEVSPDPHSRPKGQLELIVAGEEIKAARLRPREAKLVGLRVAGYSREQMAELTGDTHRSVDRQLGRARRKLRHARQSDAQVG
jgi:RNA polymerase sigma factor (sigma-70 family)